MSERRHRASEIRAQGIETTGRAATFVISEQRKTGVPPTVREVGRAIGLSSSSSAMGHLHRAVDLGLLTHVEGAVSRPFRAPIVEGICWCCSRPLEDGQ